jgi:hypothetical protein
VGFADTGATKNRFRSPLQPATYRNIRVSARKSDGDGVPDEVVLTARKGRRTLTRTFAG